MIKNYTSNSKQTFDKIQKILAAHKARQVFFDYENGQVKAVAFSLEIEGKLMGFMLPARVKNVAYVMYQRTYERLPEKLQQQAYRTAWANIRDWIDAQMALIDAEQAKVEEVFLPYMIVGQNKTLFDQFQEKHFLLPDSNQ